MFSSYPSYLNPIQILSVGLYRVSQNSRIPNSERGREGPGGARKYVEKKIALPEEDISLHIHSDKIPF
jgi:hypothetical protein